MKNAREIVLTSEGLQKLQDELDNLKLVKRKEISEQLKIARSFGDLSENSEYDEAKNAQAMNEARILELEMTIKAGADPQRVLNHFEVVAMDTLVTMHAFITQ